MSASLELLRTFAATTRAKSMASAARGLKIDKATVSRRLATLERARPGLFERRPAGIEPTAAGARALEALDDVERGLAELEGALATDGDTRGAVRLTVPAPIAERLIVPALARFRDTHPEVEVVLMATSRILDLARGEADVALRGVVPSGGGITARKVGHITTTLYASRAYLARRGTPGPRNLTGHDFLDFEAGTPSLPGFEWLPAAVRRARVVLRADDPRLLVQACVAGLGVGHLPGFLAEDHRELVRLGDDRGASPIYVVTRADVRRLARVRAVATWLGEVAVEHAKWLQRGL